jgi:TRAP-type C4-dicarboxylate transport system substrate-binding protein
MKKVPILLSALIIVILLAGLILSCSKTPEPTTPTTPTQPTTPSQPKEPIPLRLIIPSPGGDPLTVKDEEIAERFNARAGGDYELKVYPGETLAKVPEYLDAVRTGAVEIADIGWPIFAGIEPSLGLIELPFLFDTIEGFAAIMDDIMTMYDPMFQEKLNQKVLGCLPTGGMEVIGTKPIKTLNDWKGTLVGCISPPLAVMADRLGAGSQVVMWTELYSALEKGVVDDGLIGFHGTLMLRITDVIDYATKFYSCSGMNGYTINLDIWNEMPPEIQNILLEEIAVTTAEWNQLFIEWDDSDVVDLEAQGIEVTLLPKAERDKWAPLVMSYTNEQLANAGEFGDRIKQMAEEANKKFPYSD